MKIVIAIVLILAIAATAGGCVIQDREDKMDTKNYEFKDFTRVEAGGAFRVDIERSDTFMVTIEADNLSNIRVEKAGDTLIIKRHCFEWLPLFHHRPVATIRMPVLTGMEITGATEAVVRDFQTDTDLAIDVVGASRVRAGNVSVGALNIKVVGASRLDGDIKAKKDVRFEVVGASKIELDGVGSNARLTVNGASHAELNEFALQNASLDISGASHATVNLNGKLDASVNGASHLYWSGTPLMGNIRITGASSINCR